MGKIIGNPSQLKDPRPRSYSHAIRLDNLKSLIFVSGQVSQAADESTMHVGDIENQVRATFSNIEAALAEVGAKLTDIVDMTTYVLDIEKHAWPFRNVRTEIFGDSAFPTSTLIEVSALAIENTLIEIDVIAAITD